MLHDIAKNSDVLVIDDQILVQGYLKYSLQELGFDRVTYVDQAERAIEAIRENYFDLIICSYDLKREQEGSHLYERLLADRLLSPASTFVFVSADTSTEIVHSIVELQPDDFLVKPFTVKEMGRRLRRVLLRKHALRAVYDLIDIDDYDKALEQVEAFLTDPAQSEHFPAALRLKGEILLHGEQYQACHDFYQAIINVQPFGWAQLGLVKALIQLSQFDEAEKILLRLAFKPDSQLKAFDLLADIQIRQEDFDMALESTLLALDISPRNLKRQRNAINLSRMTHDYATQYEVAQKMVRSARNSVYDQPEIYLNVARAGVDYAMTSDEQQTTLLINQSNEYLRRFRKQFPKEDMGDQLEVIEARILYLQDDKPTALALLESISDEAMLTDSMDALLDKAKAFHELGLFEKSMSIMDEIESRAKTQPDEGRVFIRYIQQEKSERKSIRSTPKELNNSAVQHYQRGELDEALAIFRQAYRVMPKSPSIALNLLQAIAMKSKNDPISDTSRAILQRCIYTLENTSLSESQTERYQHIRGYLSELI